MIQRGFDLLAGTGYAAGMIPGRKPAVQPTILVFDSGLGGLTVQTEIAKAMPAARLVYAADDAGFPYGAWAEPALVARILAVMDQLVRRHRPDLVVIACNTASTIALPALRARFPIPFVGTVPAIKPAAERTSSGLVTVLATEGTIRREYTRALIETYARDIDVNLVAARRLAPLAEAALRGKRVLSADILAEIAPAFVDRGGRRTDVVVLACTHYPLLLDRYRRVAPWPVTWIDPAAAIARRAISLLGPIPTSAAPEPPRAIAVFTAGGAMTPALRASLARRGIEHLAVESVADGSSSVLPGPAMGPPPAIRH